MANVNMLSFNFDDIRQEYQTDEIGYNKKLAQKMRDIKEKSKQTKCYYCGRDFMSFCNSHSVPAFCLRNIAVDGKIYTSNALIDIPYMDKEKGVKASGTFHLICQNCDSKIFSDYENPENYALMPNCKILAQIAMKNFLKNISKRLVEIELYKEMEKMESFKNFKDFLYFSLLDLSEFNEEYKKAKKLSLKNSGYEYHLFFYKKLDYVVPMAFQGPVALVADFESNTINDIYVKNPRYKIKNLHLCVFPLEHSSSIILMFVRPEYHAYRGFIQQLSKLSVEDQLATLNYIIFAYAEDWVISPKVGKEVTENKDLVGTSKKTLVAEGSYGDCSPLLEAKKSFDLSKRDSIPNLLLPEYSINERGEANINGKN